MSSKTNSEVVLMVQIDLQPEHRDEWLSGFEAVVQHVTDNEPHTLAYQVYIDNKDRNTIHIYERYVNEHAWHDIHEKSEPFLKHFAPDIVQRTVKNIHIKQMTEAGMGFLSR